MKDSCLNLVITGFMGTGKSSAGKLTAFKLGMDFIDIDEEIKKYAGMTIPQIFEAYGEEHFRELEKNIVAKYAREKGRVIATGGGVVLFPENMNALRKNGLIVLLKSRPEVILRNISGRASRPLLNCENPMNNIIKLLEERAEFYSNNDVEIEVSDLSIGEVANSLVDVYCSRLGQSLL